MKIQIPSDWQTLESSGEDKMTEWATELVKKCEKVQDEVHLRLNCKEFYENFLNSPFGDSATHRIVDDFLFRFAVAHQIDAYDLIIDLTLELVGVQIQEEASLGGSVTSEQLDLFRTQILARLKSSREFEFPGLGRFELREEVSRVDRIHLFSDELANEALVEAEVREQIQNPVLRSLFEFLSHHSNLRIQGLGTFTKKIYPGYQGRNPRTGAVIEVPGKAKLFLKGERIFLK